MSTSTGSMTTFFTVIATTLLIAVTGFLFGLLGITPLILFTSAWVYLDACVLHNNHKLSIGNTQPGVWLIVCLLFWLVGFPLYLSGRIDAQEEDTSLPLFEPSLFGVIFAAEVVGVWFAMLFLNAIY